MYMLYLYSENLHIFNTLDISIKLLVNIIEETYNNYEIHIYFETFESMIFVVFSIMLILFLFLFSRFSEN